MLRTNIIFLCDCNCLAMRMIKLYLISATAWCKTPASAVMVGRATQRNLYDNLCDGNSHDWFFFGSPSVHARFSPRTFLRNIINVFIWYERSSIHDETSQLWGCWPNLPSAYTDCSCVQFSVLRKKNTASRINETIKFNIHYVQLMRNKNRTRKNSKNHTKMRTKMNINNK